MPRRWFSIGSGLLGLMLSVPSPALGAGWELLPPTPTARTEVAVAALEGKIYLMGGFGEEGISSRVDVYDTATGRWSEAAPLPDTLHHAAAAALEGFIYVVGGFNNALWSPVNTLYRYDPRTDTWTARAPMPTERGALAAAVVDGKLYAMGGAARKMFRLKNVAANEVYDPVTNRWSSRASLPTPRDHFTLSAVGGKLFAIGGRIDVDYNRNLNVNEMYDPETDRWQTRAPLPTPRSGITSQVLNGKIHVFGGESGQGTFAQNEAYDPLTNRWTTHPPMPHPCHGLGSAVVDGRIHLLTGGPRPGGGGSRLHQVYSE